MRIDVKSIYGGYLQAFFHRITVYMVQDTGLLRKREHQVSQTPLLVRSTYRILCAIKMSTLYTVLYCER